MAYLEEFSNSIAARNSMKVTELWQEYCESDEADAEEIAAILSLIKQSEMSRRFGDSIEQILPLIMTLSESRQKLTCLAYVFDIQSTNSQKLWDLAQQIVQLHFNSDPQLQEKLRLVGLRTKNNFQGAISNLLLLNHIKEGNFVLHNAGWGVGEIVNSSLLREQITIEFENLGGSKRDISFKNAYKSLLPLPNTSFLALRYAHPEILGKMAVEDSVGLVALLIKDTGPKTAQEIKELISGTVIDDSSYSKWWQLTRGKLKKDARIEVPDNLKSAYNVRKGSITLEERIKKGFENKKSFKEILSATHGLIRDFPALLKYENTRSELFQKIAALLEEENISKINMLQIQFLLEDIDATKAQAVLHDTAASWIHSVTDFQKEINLVDIVSLRKRFLTTIQTLLPHWISIFSDLVLNTDPTQLKDYIMKELLHHHEGKKLFTQKIECLLEHPIRYPDAFLWYFQKIVEKSSKGASLLFSDIRSIERFFESFLLLYSTIEFKHEMKDVVKKMYALLTGDRFKIVRDLLKETDIIYAKEFLLLASKCRSLTDHDQKILRSLAAVVHPSLAVSDKEESSFKEIILWTTEESYFKMKERIHHIGTVDVVDNAREIEEARKLGDLRENSEYKFALERRARLQQDLKSLSDQFQNARVITPDDISIETVGIGTQVEVIDSDSCCKTYTILGPWDANSEANILSIESKVAQAFLGKKITDTVEVQGKKVVISNIRSFFK